MEFPSKVIEALVDKLTQLPGIGRRTATRMVLNLLKQEDEHVNDLGDLVKSLVTDVHYCEICHNISNDNICEICKDRSRDQETICIVEDLRDILAIEQTNQFRGLYHVLGGVISPIDGINPDDLNFETLFQRLSNGSVKEVIFALSANMEGDTTMFYISKQIKGLDIKTSMISRGIAVGGELEYADEITLGRSITNRTPYQQ